MQLQKKCRAKRGDAMELITETTELFENVSRLNEYLHKSDTDRDFARDLIRRGICFVVTQQNGNAFFSPSRFVGYRGNTHHDHLRNEEKDGRETNAALDAILQARAVTNDAIETEYEQFCMSLGINARNAPFGVTRKFWDLR